MTSTRTRLAGFLALISLVLVAGACGGDEEPQGRPTSSAMVRIMEPEPGSVYEPGAVMIRLELQNGRVVDRVSRDLTPDEGHIHILLNGAVVTEIFGLEQEIEVTEPGNYLLEAEFVALDHAPFNPRVLDSVTFVVE